MGLSLAERICELRMGRSRLRRGPEEWKNLLREFRAGIAKGERAAGCTAAMCKRCTVSAKSYGSSGF